MGGIDINYCAANREEVEQIQLERLQAVLHRVYRNVEYYRESFRSRAFFPDDLVNLEMLRRLPTTGRATLVANHPYGMFAVPLREVIRLQATSSVVSEAIVVGFTRNDIDHWTELAARSLLSAGVGRDDFVHICIDYGLFPGALGLHYGAERIGASVIPGSNMAPDAEFEMMRNYHTTVLVTTPQRALRLAKYILSHHVKAKALMLRTCLLVGQYWSESVRARIEETLDCSVFDCYGHSEIVASGIAAECKKRNGLHINEDHFIAEIVDPVTGEALPEGQKGELTITTLTKEAFPLIRYRTGDITRLEYEPCECGCCFARMDRVSSWTDDMVFIGGVNVFPSQVERIICDAAGVSAPAPVFQLVVEGDEASESVEVAVEVNEAFFSDELKVLREIEEKIRGELFDTLGVAAKVRLVEPGNLNLEPKGKGRFVDRREVNES
ncbi:MAG: phenylacetate--CoA ligase [Candidatus Lindowbacteria bacterium]|nr:phenylacetate--CoA ligase [Candidatus Lindowbacteria bacterium]